MTTVFRVDWFVTRRCQMRCPYCKMWDREHDTCGADLTTEEAIRVVNLLADLYPGTTVVMLGGEPTLRDDLPEIVRAFAERGMKHALISNGERVLAEPAYAKRLADAGLSNWSFPLDGIERRQVLDDVTWQKAQNSLQSARIMRDEYGVRDLLAACALSVRNMSEAPELVEFFTSEGFWCCLPAVQVRKSHEGKAYSYSAGRTKDLPYKHQVRTYAPVLASMASSGRYLIHNRPEFFEAWISQDLARAQDWMCDGKAYWLSVDADGSLRYCHDIHFPPEQRMSVFELATEEGREKFAKLRETPPPCVGCGWDAFWEPTMQGRRNAGEKGKRLVRHEIGEKMLRVLKPNARHWFRDNPCLQRVKP